MPIPFPGMNPYLEHPDLWPQVHQKMIQSLADTLNHQLPANYQVRLRERYYRVSGEDSLVVGAPGLNWRDINRAHLREAQPIPGTTAHRHSQRSERSVEREDGQDGGQSNGQNAPVPATDRTDSAQPISVLIPVPQKIYETYLEIVDTTGEIVTIIEALSPKKKRPGRGRLLYERQREAIFGSNTHFVEIDLLRGWEPASIYGPDEAGDYRILLSRSEQRPRAQLYVWNVTEPIPDIRLPLSGHEDILLNLKAVIDQACDRTDLLVNYQKDPLPPLRASENIWLENFLQQVGMRPCVS
ncbi:MAG: DUF4058 family protein [Cyanobacteria bacterium P01_D01_bin.36]